MAKTQSKRPRSNTDEDLPEGCEPLTGARVAGWYVTEKGNTLQGVIRDRYESKGDYGLKRVYKVLVTKGKTKIVNDGVEAMAEPGIMVGLDEKGYLKKLADVENGREIFVKCKGKGEATEKGRQAPWVFAVGVFPKSDADDSEELPF